MSWLDTVRRLIGIEFLGKISQNAEPVLPLKKKDNVEASPTTLPPKADSSQPSNEKLSKLPPLDTPGKITSPIPASDSLTNTKRKQSSSLSGDMTQYPTTNSASPKLMLNIGLDFGTAFTKVVVGESRVCYAIPFQNKESENPYLLPCVIYIEKSGKCSLHQIDESYRPVFDLKMKLLDDKAGDHDLVRMVAFIALIFRHTRLWILENQRSTYEGRFLDWYVNTGVPTDSYHHIKLSKTYKTIVRSAWALSVAPDPVSIPLAADLLSHVSKGSSTLSKFNNDLKNRLIHEDAFALFPEFVAQVVGYVRSPLRRPDLHMMVDIGAGTVDISIFNVHESDEEDVVYPIFEKAVKPLGTNYLMHHRGSKLFAGQNFKLSGQDKTPSQQEFVQTFQIPFKQLSDIDKEFTKHIGLTMRELLKSTKDRRYPKSPCWQTGIPTFLCGGGGRVDVYDEVVRRLENPDQAYKIKVLKLPQPDRISAPKLPSGCYDRLSVAYGLSFNAFDIGRVIPAHEIEDVKQFSVARVHHYVGKDEV